MSDDKEPNEKTDAGESEGAAAAPPPPGPGNAKGPRVGDDGHTSKVSEQWKSPRTAERGDGPDPGPTAGPRAALPLAFAADADTALAERALRVGLGGAPDDPLVLTLHPTAPGTAAAEVYELEVSPSPIREDVEIVFLFPGDLARVFRLEVPPEVRCGEPPRERTRSEPCHPLPPCSPPLLGHVTAEAGRRNAFRIR